MLCELLAVGEEVLGRQQRRAGEAGVRGHRPIGARLGVERVVALGHRLRGGDCTLGGGDVGRSRLGGRRECGLGVGQSGLLLLHLQTVLLVLGVGELRGTGLLDGRLVRRHHLLVGVQLGVEGAQVLGGEDFSCRHLLPGLHVDGHDRARVGEVQVVHLGGAHHGGKGLVADGGGVHRVDPRHHGHGGDDHGERQLTPADVETSRIALGQGRTVDDADTRVRPGLRTRGRLVIVGRTSRPRRTTGRWACSARRSSPSPSRSCVGPGPSSSDLP